MVQEPKREEDGSLVSLDTGETELQGPRELLEKVIEALRQVYDPEIPVNIFDLGLVYRVAVTEAGDADIRMTLTSPGCPVAGSMPGEVERVVTGVPGIRSAKVELVWDPPWSQDRMSEAAKLELGLF
ncbi:MAG: SUF system Fe-S cluster assembly protein [Acidobacteriota bacterium]